MRKNTYEYVYEFIKNKGCKLLDKSYNNQEEKLNILFSCGHVGIRTFARMKDSGNVCNKCAGVEKYEFQDVFDYFKINGYRLLDKEYISCKKRLTFEDTEGYLYYCTFDQFKFNIIERKISPNRWDTGNIYTIENILNYLKTNSSPFKMDKNQEWRGNTTKFTFTDKNKYKYYMTFDMILRYEYEKTYPPICESSNIYSTNNINRWLELNKKPFTLLTNQIYKNSTTKLQFKCHKCNSNEIPFLATWMHIQTGGGCGLCVCSQIGKYNNLKAKYPDVAKQWDYDNNYPVLPEEISPHAKGKYYWVCSDCNSSYLSTVHHKTSGEPRGCPVCNESNGEKRVRKILTEWKQNGVISDFKTQVRFSQCKDQQCLPFDFQVFIGDDYFICEYMGIQHESPVKLFGGSDGFADRKKKDKIKKDFCEKNGIPFLEIWYNDYKNVDSILSNYLSYITS